MTGLLEFLGRPSDPASFPFYIRRCRERVHELQANIRRLEDEKQRLINEIHEIQVSYKKIPTQKILTSRYTNTYKYTQTQLYLLTLSQNFG